MSSLDLEDKLLATILFIIQNIVCMGFCVVLENMYADNNTAIRKSAQYFIALGAVLNVLITREIMSESMMLMTKLWWCTTIVLSIIAIILYPFAKRWIL